MTHPKPPTVSRREARISAMRILFATLGGNTTAAAAHDYIKKMSDNKERQLLALTDELVLDIVRIYDYRHNDINRLIEEYYQRPLSQMTLIERAILCVSAAEVLGYPQTPVAVIINEAVEIAKQFGLDSGHTLVNGILNHLVEQVGKTK